MSNNVLFVTYHFPPDAAVGALRSQKFVKYLPENGWQPYVLTLQDRFYPVHDNKRLEDINDAIVERTDFWRTPLQCLFDIRDVYIRKGNCQRPEKIQINSMTSSSKKITRAPYIIRFLVGLNFLPDEYLYWFIPGFIKGVRMVRDNDIRHIFVSAPPSSSIILAYLLAVWTGTSLVVDFRDPWMLSHQQGRELFKPGVLISGERALQRHIFKRTSAILTTNEFFRRAFLKENPFLTAEQVHVVHNGFDSSDYPRLHQKVSTGKYIISYLGTFYMKRTPENFLKGLSRFMQEKGLNEDDLEVKFIGDVGNACGMPVDKMIRGAGLENVVRMIGTVDYVRALDFMCNSDLLLLLAPDQPYQIPAKTYEYMATKRPILVIADPGATASLVEETHSGICVEPWDIQGMSVALHRLYDDYLHGGMSYVCDASRFERRVQAAQLATILGNVEDAVAQPLPAAAAIV